MHVGTGPGSRSRHCCPVPGTSTLGPGSGRPAGPARSSARGARQHSAAGPMGRAPFWAGRAGWTGSESRPPVEDAGRVPSACVHPQAKGTRTQHLGMDAEGQWAEARGRGRGRDSTGLGGAGSPREKGPFAGLSLPTGTEHQLQPVPGREDTPRPSTPWGPLRGTGTCPTGLAPIFTSGHKAPSATTCRPASMGRLRSQVGLTAPCPCRVSRVGVPFPFSLLKPQVPPLPRPASSELRTLMVTLFSPQFKRTSAALSPPRAQP